MATVANEQYEADRVPAQKDLVGVLAEFSGPRELVAAARKVRTAGFSKFECYSPFPIHGIDDAMGTKPTILPWLSLGAAFVGIITAMVLQWSTNGFFFPYIISGKPLISIPASIPVMFELAILFACFATLFGMLGLNGLPCLYNALHRVDAFRDVTSHKFFLGIESADPQFDEEKVHGFIETLGPIAVEAYYDSTESKEIPFVFYKIILALGVVALIPPVVITQFQTIPSNKPRLHPIQDMDFQPKLKTQRVSPLFADGRGMRPRIPGTVAQGRLQADSALYRGLKPGAATDAIDPALLMPGAVDENKKAIDLKQFPWVEKFPVEVNAALMERGEKRFLIYCAPCHGVQGFAKGLVTQRAMELMKNGKAAWLPPISLHSEGVIKQPIGQLFNTITNGVRKMPAYGPQIPPEDRWAILLYVKALQRSRHATIEDVPEDKKGSLQELKLPIPVAPKKKEAEGKGKTTKQIETPPSKKTEVAKPKEKKPDASKKSVEEKQKLKPDPSKKEAPKKTKPAETT